MPEVNTSPGRIGRARTVVYAATACLLVLLALEGTLRLVSWLAGGVGSAAGAPQSASDQPGNVGGGLAQDVDYSRDIPYRFSRNASGVLNGGYVHLNNVGLRGSQPVLGKRPGSFRIVCLGDSVTFGYSATSNEASYPAILQQRFDATHNDVEVLNAGMPGFRSKHLCALLEQIVLPLQPDLVLVQCGWNDPPDFAPGASVATPSFWRRVADSIYLIRVPTRLVNSVREGDPTWHERNRKAFIEKARKGPAKLRPDAGKLYQESLVRMVQICRDADVRIALIRPAHFLDRPLEDAALEKSAGHLALYPSIGVQGWRAMVHKMIDINRTIAERFEIPLIDTSTLDDHRLFADICHLTDEGNQRLAEIIYAALEQHELVPPKP